MNFIADLSKNGDRHVAYAMKKSQSANFFAAYLNFKS